MWKHIRRGRLKRNLFVYTHKGKSIRTESDRIQIKVYVSVDASAVHYTIYRIYRGPTGRIWWKG